jgi:hypothetical protein
MKNNDTPLFIDRYIKLITEKELDKDSVKAWFHCVKRYAPSGVLKTVNMVNDKGKPSGVALIHREGEETNSYLVPLTRDLNEEEIDTIVQEFAKKKPDIDFTIESNETKLTAKNNASISLDAAKHLSLCTALEKAKHENWVRERTDGGWRYGTEFDADEKTHPLILPWDQLPDRFKKPDMDWPQKLVHMLNDNGYAIISKDELNDLLKNLRSL